MTEQQICPHDEICPVKKITEGLGKYCTENKQSVCRAASYYAKYGNEPLGIGAMMPQGLEKVMEINNGK